MKPSKYKALISDIDGTLIPNTPEGRPSKKVVEKVKAASKLIHIGVATSRPFFHAKPIIRDLNLTAPCIVGGGSQIVDPKTERIIWEKRLTTEEVKSLKDLLHKKIPGLELIDDKDHMISEELSDYVPLQLWSPTLEPEDADDILKIAEQIPTIAINKVPSYNQGKVALVITSIEATKQQAILEVAKLLGIQTSEIIGIGDGSNDFPLLMACGLKVAIGNAVEDLKAIADYIAPSVDDDGVADVLEKFVLNAK